MKNKILIIFSFLVLLTGNLYAQFFRDPFESLLPREQGPNTDYSGKAIMPPNIKIEGVMWGDNKPRVIIDGEVYKTGDDISGVEAKVFKIQKNTVFISYGERIFEMRVQK